MFPLLVPKFANGRISLSLGVVLLLLALGLYQVSKTAGEQNLKAKEQADGLAVGVQTRGALEDVRYAELHAAVIHVNASMDRVETQMTEMRGDIKRLLGMPRLTNRVAGSGGGEN